MSTYSDIDCRFRSFSLGTELNLYTLRFFRYVTLREGGKQA